MMQNASIFNPLNPTVRELRNLASEFRWCDQSKEAKVLADLDACTERLAEECAREIQKIREGQTRLPWMKRKEWMAYMEAQGEWPRANVELCAGNLLLGVGVKKVDKEGVEILVRGEIQRYGRRDIFHIAPIAESAVGGKGVIVDKLKVDVVRGTVSVNQETFNVSGIQLALLLLMLCDQKRPPVEFAGQMTEFVKWAKEGKGKRGVHWIDKLATGKKRGGTPCFGDGDRVSKETRITRTLSEFKTDAVDGRLDAYLPEGCKQPVQKAIPFEIAEAELLPKAVVQKLKDLHMIF